MSTRGLPEAVVTEQRQHPVMASRKSFLIMVGWRPNAVSNDRLSDYYRRPDRVSTISTPDPPDVPYRNPASGPRTNRIAKTLEALMS